MSRIDNLHDSSLAYALDRTSVTTPTSLLSHATSPRAPFEPFTKLDAITILLNHPDDIVFAYIRFARSLHPDLHYFPGHGSLSREQVLAVSALRDCSDDEISTWLNEVRKLSEIVAYLLKLQQLSSTSKGLGTARVLTR